MRVDIITIFPRLFDAFIDESIIKRARQKGKISIMVHDLRAFSKDKRKKIDDRPFGGGPGMIFTVQPLFDALKGIKKNARAKNARVILLSPHGEKFSQKLAEKISRYKNIILVCGHYEGIDQRFIDNAVDQQLSIGDYILTGGEIPAMVIIEAAARLLPGVLGHEESAKFESFTSGMLEYPQYTRPAVYKKIAVPEVLLSGNHNKIKKWRSEQSLAATKRLRPDLLA